MNTDKIFAEALVNEYSPKNTSKVVALKKLDKKAKLPAEIFTYSFGITSSLVFGLGMSLCMEVIGPATVGSMILGIVIGLLGMLGMSINYNLYKKILAKGKAKYAFEIIELAKEIAKEA